MNHIDSDPTKFIAIGVVTCSNVFHGFLKALNQGDKMFQKFVETLDLLKNMEVFIHQLQSKA